MDSIARTPRPLLDWYDYQDGRLMQVKPRFGAENDPSFGALLVALINKADDSNLRLIRMGFGPYVDEVQRRNSVAGGLIEGDPEEARREVYAR